MQRETGPEVAALPQSRSPADRIDSVCLPYCQTPSWSEIDGIFVEAAAGTEYKPGDPRGPGLAAAFARSWRSGSYAPPRNMVEFVCRCQDLDEETTNGESLQLSIPQPGSLSVLVRSGHQHGIPSIILARFFRFLAGANEQGDGVIWMRSGPAPLRGAHGAVALP